jgi:hypothetical protein
MERRRSTRLARLEEERKKQEEEELRQLIEEAEGMEHEEEDQEQQEEEEEEEETSSSSSSSGTQRIRIGSPHDQPTPSKDLEVTPAPKAAAATASFPFLLVTVATLMLAYAVYEMFLPPTCFLENPTSAYNQLKWEADEICHWQVPCPPGASCEAGRIMSCKHPFEEQFAALKEGETKADIDNCRLSASKHPEEQQTFAVVFSYLRSELACDEDELVAQAMEVPESFGLSEELIQKMGDASGMYSSAEGLSESGHKQYKLTSKGTNSLFTCQTLSWISKARLFLVSRFPKLDAFIDHI